jgi:FAD/FMN-containing dehydrogenase
MARKYESWGRYPQAINQNSIQINWGDQLSKIQNLEGSLLPYGLGRSYGDVCLNSNGAIINVSGLNRFIEIDFNKGIVKAQAGVSLDTILRIAVPAGWFLSVTPGTKYVTLGGAIANDVHGKNHHKMGTFGCHVLSFVLLRSDGTSYLCSETENVELFISTIGGLGLTGIITEVEIQLQKIIGPKIDATFIKFDNLEEYVEITSQKDDILDYTVSWVDCTSTGSRLGRGIYSGGNFTETAELKKFKKSPPRFPFDYPFINPFSVQAFNYMYFNKQVDKKKNAIIDYEPFFYPLDAVDEWNKAYGKNGFLQYQFVIPFESGIKGLKSILNSVAESGKSSFLTVLKTFGNIKSPGILSFPRPGYTMAIDFRMDGLETLKLLERLDEIVKEFGGILYPAKDARMASKDFKLFYPEFEIFKNNIDEKFSSDFIRRINKEN